MTYSIVDSKKEYVTVHRIGIANQHLSSSNTIADIIDFWLKSYGIVPPNKKELKEYVRCRSNGKRLEFDAGNLIMFESKNAGWIIDYEEEQPSGSREILTVSQHDFENYLYENAKRNTKFTCPLLNRSI